MEQRTLANGGIRYAESIPLGVGVKPEDGVIVEVGPYRHGVLWAGEDESSGCTYCNRCGSPFALSGRVNAAADPAIPEIYICAGCRVFQGFTHAT